METLDAISKSSSNKKNVKLNENAMRKEYLKEKKQIK